MKIWTALLVVGFSIGISACGKTGNPLPDSSSESPQPQVQSQTSQPTATHVSLGSCKIESSSFCIDYLDTISSRPKGKHDLSRDDRDTLSNSCQSYSHRDPVNGWTNRAQFHWQTCEKSGVIAYCQKITIAGSRYSGVVVTQIKNYHNYGGKTEDEVRQECNGDPGDDENGIFSTTPFDDIKL